MAIINLRNYYPWYTYDEFVEVPDNIASELFADKRYHKTHERIIRRNDVRSLDAQDGTDAAAAISNFTDNPEAIFEKMESHCRLCCALNSLPETQGRRVDAHYILGMSQKQIAKSEGVNERKVRKSISKGLANMRKYLEIRTEGGPICPKNCPDI